MSEKKAKSNKIPARTTCHRCIAIRIFLSATVGVGLLQVIAPQTFQLVRGSSPMTLAILFVCGFGLLAIIKSIGDHYSDHSDNSNNLE